MTRVPAKEIAGGAISLRMNDGNCSRNAVRVARGTYPYKHARLVSGTHDYLFSLIRTKMPGDKI